MSDGSRTSRAISPPTRNGSDHHNRRTVPIRLRMRKVSLSVGGLTIFSSVTGGRPAASRSGAPRTGLGNLKLKYAKTAEGTATAKMALLQPKRTVNAPKNTGPTRRPARVSPSRAEKTVDRVCTG
jgi:hypothetical protein